MSGAGVASREAEAIGYMTQCITPRITPRLVRAVIFGAYVFEKEVICV